MERSQHEGSQEASSRANQASVFITQGEMEMMVEAIQEGMLKRQEEMMQNLLQQVGQTRVQNQGNTMAGDARDGGQEHGAIRS